MKNLVLFGMIGFALPTMAFAGVQEGLDMLKNGDAQGAAGEFQTAYDAGDGDGAFYLGRMFEMGAGAQSDPNRAANLYAAGVEKGSTMAMNRLGLMYMDGTVLLRDYAEAARLFCQAADAGDADGELNCGVSYRTGRGVEKSGEKAIEYLNKASEQGNIAAKNILGQMYSAGEDVEADAAKALEYFEATADEGNAMGLYELAKHYQNLETPDLVQAYSYANLASVRGMQEAIQMRNQLELEMSPEDITKAQAMARAWTEERVAAAASPADESAASETTASE